MTEGKRKKGKGGEGEGGGEERAGRRGVGDFFFFLEIFIYFNKLFLFGMIFLLPSNG